MRIGDLNLGHRPLLLAPMEDVSDPPFRIICKRYGADLLYTEFISSGGLVYGAEGSVRKLEFYEEERPVGIQRPTTRGPSLHRSLPRPSGSRSRTRAISP